MTKSIKEQQAHDKRIKKALELEDEEREKKRRSPKSLRHDLDELTLVAGTLTVVLQVMKNLQNLNVSKIIEHLEKDEKQKIKDKR